MYQHSFSTATSSGSHSITADDMLVAARQLDRYTRRTAPRAIELRILEDGSVLGLEAARHGIGHLSLAGVALAVREMYDGDCTIPLWQKLLELFH